jgi:hypothetical protein
MTEEGRAAECLAALARTGAPHSSHPSARRHGLALLLLCGRGKQISKRWTNVRGVFLGFFSRDLEIACVARFMKCLEDLKNADTQDQVL